MTAPDTHPTKRLGQAAPVLLAWLAATMLIGTLLRQGKPAAIPEIIAALSSGIAWNVVAGLVVLALATWIFGWRDLGFVAPRGRAVLRLMWFPLLCTAPIFALAFAIGPPPTAAIGYLALNTSLVALSEEWMFRGILFRALAARLTLLPAALVSSLAFGAIHVLNAFAFGDLSQALGQSVAATMTGMLLVALLIRTGSIWPSVGFHMVWNFGLLLVTYEAAETPLPQGPLPLQAYLLPLIIVMPNLLYALLLLRKAVRGPV